MPNHRFIVGALFVLLLIASSASADTTAVSLPDTSVVDTASLTIPDTTPIDSIHPPPDSQQSLRERVEGSESIDSLLARIRGDSTAADSATPVRVRDFHAIETLFDSLRVAFRQVREPVVLQLPQPEQLAVVDAADWLVLQPTVDVADAQGPGHVRQATRWGLVDRHNWWFDDAGEALDVLRLGFPQTAQADLNLVPLFLYDSIELRDQLHLKRDTGWPLRARSSYFLRQGYYGETYSQGDFRRLFTPGYGIDLGFGFYQDDGVIGGNAHDYRHLRLRLVGPVGENMFWNFRFTQFRDESTIRPPFPYDLTLPRRNDLVNKLEGTVYRPSDSLGQVSPWIVGFSRQSTKQDVTDGITDYRHETHGQRYDLWTQRSMAGWFLDARAILEAMRIDEEEPSRWGFELEASRTYRLGENSQAAIRTGVADWDTDPFAPIGEVSLQLPAILGTFVPGLRVSRTRNVPWLFDRIGTRRDYSIPGGFTSNYAEIGDPSLSAEWRNDITATLLHSGDSTGGPTFGIIGHAGYVEEYTTWSETFSEALDTTLLTPLARDVRHVGAAATFSSQLPWKMMTWLNYGFKYAAELNHQQLTAYNPHSASWVLSWIAPQFRYEIDLQLTSALMWWVGDSRYQVTQYASSPNVFRWDLSATARMHSFTFHYSLQNVTNFPYRSQSGGDFAVQRMRFGIAWHFID